MIMKGEVGIVFNGLGNYMGDAGLDVISERLLKFPCFGLSTSRIARYRKWVCLADALSTIAAH